MNIIKNIMIGYNDLTQSLKINGKIYRPIIASNLLKINGARAFKLAHAGKKVAFRFNESDYYEVATHIPICFFSDDRFRFFLAIDQ